MELSGLPGEVSLAIVRSITRRLFWTCSTKLTSSKTTVQAHSGCGAPVRRGRLLHFAWMHS